MFVTMILTLENNMKKCKKCNLEKEKSCFHKHTGSKDRLAYNCKDCCHNIAQETYMNNKEKIDKRRKEYAIENKERIKAVRLNYFSSEQYRKRKAEYDIEYRKNNKEKIAEHKKRWELKNRNEINFKIVRNLRRRIHHVIKDNYKSDSTIQLLGCTVEEFIKYLENQFTDGMTWENYGVDGWHIDHILPCSSFDLSIEENQRKCFHFSNMQPLWAIDNLKKSKKIPY